jgi:hypothetical protein
MNTQNYENTLRTGLMMQIADAGERSEVLALRLEAGAAALAAFARTLSEKEWVMPMPKDGRKIGVIVHHVANMYPVEVELATMLAKGRPITGVTWEGIAAINAEHAQKNDAATMVATLDLLMENSAAAATAIRAMSNADLDSAAPVSLYGNAPLTCQFFLEDHAVRHSYHHLAKIRSALVR